jgi:hypothetical protein
MVTTRRRPHSGQWRGGSSGRPHPPQTADGRPHPVQWAMRSYKALPSAPTGMRRSSSIARSSPGERPSVVR